MNQERYMDLLLKIVKEPPKPSANWREAFEIYNTARNETLTMSCMPCYGKVLGFIHTKAHKIEPPPPIDGGVILDIANSF